MVLSSTAGKARISIVWMVTVGVLFLAAVFFAFIAQSELTKERERVAAANQSAADMTEKLTAEQEVRRNLSTAIGWYDTESADPLADVEGIQKGLADLKSTFTDLGPAEKTYDKAIPKILAAYAERGRQIAELQTRNNSLQSEVSAAQQATAQVTSDKDGVISGLRQQVADEQNNAKNREQELEGRLEALRTQVADRDSELRRVREEAAATKRAHDERERILMARINQLSDDTKLIRGEYATVPDGEILEVSDRLGTGWINLGANQRIVRGMRFQVRSGRTGSEQTKAWAEVTSVKADSAEVRLGGLVDRFDPVVAGDVIVNPIYDPRTERNAVLVGRFSGAYNERELTTMLARMGIHVQPRLDLTTHYLIVGSELWNDPETSEPLEEPIQPSDLPEYKEAESKGVQIIPLQDLREYFRAGAGT
jgi:septal ring factor EnvC (AmiA/AmiB activator)